MEIVVPFFIANIRPVNLLSTLELGAAIAPTLVTSANDDVHVKLAKIMTVILDDQLEARLDRQEAIACYASSERLSNLPLPPVPFGEADDDDDAAAASASAAAAAAALH